MFSVKKSDEFPGSQRTYHLGFFRILQEFRVAGKYSDLTIECDDQRFICHRLLLAASCDYFDLMFNRGFKETTDRCVVIKDIVDGATFDYVLRFIYASADDEVENIITSTYIHDLFLASKVLLFRELECQCVHQYFMKTFTSFFERLDEYRVSEKLVDVTIVCGDKTFKCHRLVLAVACDYFNCVFSVCDNSVVILPANAVNGEAFETLLHFMYARNDVVITPQLFFLVLKAHEFLKVNGHGYFEHLFVEFVQKNMPHLPDVMEIFLFACTTKLNRLIYTLSLYLTKPLKTFFKTDTFLEIPLDILLKITKHWMSTSKDALVKAIIRWISFSRQKRLHHFAEIVSLDPFKNTSSVCVQTIVQRLITGSEENTSLTRVDRPATTSRCSEATKYLLHIFVDTAVSEFAQSREDLCSRVYSVTPRQNCYLHCDTYFNSVVSHLKITAVNDTYLYCLSSPRLTEFTLTTDSNDEFWRCTTIDMHSKINLKLPPITMPASYHLLGLPNYDGIFLFVRSPITRWPQPAGSPHFSDEEIKRGVYCYNRSLDTWSSVPAPQEQVKKSCVAELDNRLYVGGRLKLNQENSVQTYDYRSGIWQIMPTPEFFPKAMTVLNGKIYASSGLTGSENTKCAKYDPAAGKWEELKSMNVQLKYSHRLIAYANQLWAMNFDDSCYGDKLHDSFVEIYNPQTEKWSHSSLLVEALVEDTKFPYFKVSEVVVFKDSSS